jgi:hypothetical protein
MSTHYLLTTTDLDELQARTRRVLANMRSVVRRKHLTGWVKDRSAAGHYRKALRLILVIEDTHGVEAAATLGDRLTALRQEATARGLLDIADVSRIEREEVSR